MYGRGGLDCGGLSIEINGSKKRMDQCTEASPAWALGPDAGHELDPNTIGSGFAAGQRRHDLHRDRRAGCLAEGFSAYRLPPGIHLFASGRGRTVGISFQDVLLAYGGLLLHVQPKDSGIPPYDRGPAGT